MADTSLVTNKKSEVRQLAKKYGVESYLGTQRLEMADAYIQMWAKDAESMDSLEASSSWIDAKSEIEDMMASLSLEQNSKSSLYLLGASATGQINFDEVRLAYIEGWNTLMEQYGGAIAPMNQVNMGNLERVRDRFLHQLPAFGTPNEKVQYSKLASNELRAVEGQLQQEFSNTRVNQGKMELAKRETTRTMILSEAESGFKSGRMPPQMYQEITTLIGRKNSLFEGQIKSMSLFKNEPNALFAEMDRVLQKASLMLSTQENAFSLAGTSKPNDPSYKRFRNAVATTGPIGDGLRVVKAQNMIYNTIPKHVGLDVTNYSNPPQIFPTNQVPPEATVFPTNMFRNSGAKFSDPASIFRNESNLSRFEQYRQDKAVFGTQAKNPSFTHKNAGLQGTSPLGNTGGFLAAVSGSKMVQIVLIGVAGYALTNLGKAAIQKPEKRDGFDGRIDFTQDVIDVNMEKGIDLRDLPHRQ